MQRGTILWILTYAVCICALIWPALYNGYPILYSDTASYVASGMKLDTPIDRPITYGLFIRITSIGGFTLWTTVACQAALVVRLIELLILRVRQSTTHKRLVLVSIIAILALSTSLPWVVSQVMADLFTSMMVLCAILLFLPTAQAPVRYQRILLYALFFLCVAAHLSHPVFMVILIAFLFALRVALNKWTMLRTSVRPIWTMLLLTVLAYPIMSSAIAKSGNIFFMGALAEHGVAKGYLDDHCAEDAFKLCAWKDRFPERAFQFHWDPKGPMGEYSGWPEANTEFGKIIGATFTDPKYIGMHVRASLAATWKQLGMFNIGDGWGAFHEGSDVYYILNWLMHFDMPAFEKSRQYQGHMEWIKPFIPLHAWVLRIALFALLPRLFFAFREKRTLLLIATMVILAGVFVSAWGSGTFSGEVDRFGCKMVWLVPLVAILPAVALVRDRPRGNQ